MRNRTCNLKVKVVSLYRQTTRLDVLTIAQYLYITYMSCQGKKKKNLFDKFKFSQLIKILISTTNIYIINKFYWWVYFSFHFLLCGFVFCWRYFCANFFPKTVFFGNEINFFIHVGFFDFLIRIQGYKECKIPSGIWKVMINYSVKGQKRLEIFLCKSFP